MRQEELGRGDPIGPLDWSKIVPFEAAAASDRLGWVGLEAVRYRAAPASELNPPAMTHHRLILFARPPESRCAEVGRMLGSMIQTPTPFLCHPPT